MLDLTELETAAPAVDFLLDRVEDLVGLQAACASTSSTERHSHGLSRVDRPMDADGIFSVWCLVKPIAMGATVALAESVAHGLDTSIRDLSPLAFEAGLDAGVTLDHLQSLSLPLGRTGLMEGICREQRDLRTQLIDEIAATGVPVVPFGAYHSEYTLWRLVAECLETLTGRQASTALDNLLVTAGLEAQFSMEPTSLRVHRIVDYFVDSPTAPTPLSHSRSGVLLSSWSMPLGGFVTSGAMAEWARRMFFREGDPAQREVAELFPSSPVVERMVGDLQSGRTSAVLGLRAEAPGQIGTRGWLGLSTCLVDLEARRSAVLLCNDLSSTPDRLADLSRRLLRPDAHVS